ncbi:hypothetical protein SAMN05216588_12638 [Pseudomonas flavescens]|uniref:Uncharacterized protein n=1 Tax=Phytopseudomonas flavescens TaxID=29435 RepID=A0A1G8NVY8_9GAMM|nr:hypothetical protein [Pseudomonas flavescens]SDI84431.1 hypothetical protein SAMN05216588_12638 [Pseudomonas flavescens]
MQYIVFISEQSCPDGLYSGPVDQQDADYLGTRVMPHLTPLSDEDYLAGPAAIVQTAARYGYVLDGQNLYWCIEWQPGLVVVKFSPDGKMAWAALRSPVPDFGGRVALEADTARYDEEADNPQYNLVFRSWDAQFDEQNRMLGAFEPASAHDVEAFDAALRHANALSTRLAAPAAGNLQERLERFTARCGEGIRIHS